MEVRPIPRPPVAASTNVEHRLPADRFLEAVHEQRRHAQRKAVEKAGAADPGVMLALPAAPLPVLVEQAMSLTGGAVTEASFRAGSMSDETMMHASPVQVGSGPEEAHMAVTGEPGTVQHDGGDGRIQSDRTHDASQAVRGEGIDVRQGRGAAEAPLRTERPLRTEPPRRTEPVVALRGASMPDMHVRVLAPAALERAAEVVPERRRAEAGIMPLVTPPPQQGDVVAGTTTQAQHTEEQSLTLQEHRAQQREAATLQSNLGRPAGASAAFSYAFSSWGGEHLVRVQLGATRTTVQGSSAQVEDGLRRAQGIEGVDVISLDVGSDDTDPDSDRRGRGRRERT